MSAARTLRSSAFLIHLSILTNCYCVFHYENITFVNLGFDEFGSLLYIAGYFALETCGDSPIGVLPSKNDCGSMLVFY